MKSESMRWPRLMFRGNPGPPSVLQAPGSCTWMGVSLPESCTRMGVSSLAPAHGWGSSLLGPAHGWGSPHWLLHTDGGLPTGSCTRMGVSPLDPAHGWGSPHWVLHTDGSLPTWLVYMDGGLPPRLVHTDGGLLPGSWHMDGGLPSGSHKQMGSPCREEAPRDLLCLHLLRCPFPGLGQTLPRALQLQVPLLPNLSGPHGVAACVLGGKTRGSLDGVRLGWSAARMDSWGDHADEASRCLEFLRNSPSQGQTRSSIVLPWLRGSGGCRWVSHVCALSGFSRPTLPDPMGCSPSGSSVHGILQAGTLEWAALPSSRGSSQPRD